MIGYLEMNKPLVKLTLLFMGGVIAGRYLPCLRSNAGDIFGLNLILMFSLLLLWKNLPQAVTRGLFYGGVGLTAVAAGLFRYSRLPPVSPRNIAHFLSPRPAEVLGTITDDPVFKRHTARFILRCHELYRGDREERVGGLLQVVFHGQVNEIEPTVRCGNRVRVKGKITPPEERGNPGEDSETERLATRRIYAQTRIYQPEFVTLIEKTPALCVPCLGITLKHRFQEIIRASLPDDRGRPGSLQSVLMEALMLGEKDEIPFRIRENFRVAGVIHILVVSGLHVGFIWLLGSFIFSPLPLRWRHACIIPLVAAYVLITGARNPTVRAGLMAGVVSTAFILNQPRNIWTAISFAALCLLVYNPLNLFQAGFQLSFLIVIAIIALTPVISSWLRFLPLKIRPYLSVPLAAQCGVFPLSAYYFHFISPLAFITNILVIPLSGAIVCLGFAAVMAGLIGELPARIINYPNRTLIVLLVKTVGWFSRLPFARLRVNCFPLPWVFIWYLTLLGLASRRLFPRRWKAAVTGLLVLLLAGWAALLLPARRQNLEATFFNGESGSFTAFRTPGGETVLIAPDDDPFGEVREIICPFLFKNNIRQIDYLILTRAGLNHLNVLSRLLEAVEVSTLLDHPLAPASPSYPSFRKLLQENDIRYRKLAADETVEAGELEIETLWPRPESGTEDTLVCKLRFGEVTFLFPASVPVAAQKELVRLRTDLRATVLKVPSRGSRARNCPEFLRAVDPEYALLIQGQKYFGRYPRDCAPELEKIGAEAHCTGEEGCLTVETDGKKCRVISSVSKNTVE